MDEMSPAVAVTVSLATIMCDNSITDPAKLKLEPETIELLSDCNCNNSEILNVASSKTDVLETPENGQLGHDVQESEEDDILSVSSVELQPVDPTSDISVPVITTSENSLPIDIEVEGVDNVAKVISLEERSIRRRLSEDLLTVPTKPDEECSSASTIKASNEQDSNKGGVKSVFELDCPPLWGSVSICGYRPEMEDAVMVVPHFMNIPIKLFTGDHGIDGISQTLTHLTSHFFGVYDGHGGSQVADYCRDRIHLALAEEFNSVKDDLVNGTTIDSRQVKWESVFRSCFLKVDDEVGGKVSRKISDADANVCNSTSDPVAPETVGSTAVVAVVCSSHIVVSNCGDSRAVLYRGKEAIALSVDHKPNREDEYARIEASGGKVIQWNGHRVFGVLAMSRSIGDRYLKPWIIPEPEVMFVPRAREDECLILASDGLWDVISNEEACEVARRQILIWHKRNGGRTLTERVQGVDPAAQAAAEYLSNIAIKKGSKDNISVIVVDLRAQRKLKMKS